MCGSGARHRSLTSILRYAGFSQCVDIVLEVLWSPVVGFTSLVLERDVRPNGQRFLDRPGGIVESTQFREGGSKGQLTPLEGAAVMGLVESYRRTLETSEIEARIAALETGK